MFMWDKKKSLETLMSKRKPSGGESIAGPTPMLEEHVSDENGEPDMKHLAAQNMMDAFHSKSAHKLRQAMDDYLDIHSMSKMDDDEPKPSE